ncbi:MAG: TonB-dependent receptor [Phycisphaerae bacterium]|nr:TonB-dependent receptor [Gemmatimonadaceae bacterium]
MTITGLRCARLARSEAEVGASASFGCSFGRALLAAATLGLAGGLSAQSSDSTAQQLRPVSVTVTRDAARSVFELPFALARITPDSLHPGQRRTSLGELLLGIPGVQVQERNNPSQDPRLAVRGFGARSAFGVRGVRVMRDGIPLTLPDGQTPVDWMDLESAGSVEVIRGTAASLYGNAAGGVVSIRSHAPGPAPFSLSARGWDGGNLQRASVMLSGSGPERWTALRESGYLVSGTRTEGDGPRDYSRQQTTSVFARALGTIKDTRLELQGVRYDAPTSENPGALTAAELSRNPRLADSLNITKHSRKAVEQSQVAILATRGNSASEISASLFMGSRALDNPLPFAIVGVDRKSYGGSLRGGMRTTLGGFPLRMTAGLDAQTQHDDRFNYENCSDVSLTTPVTTRCPVSGKERGAVRLNQREEIQGEGAYVRYELEVPRKLMGSVSLRYDRVRFRLADRFIAGTNGDDSGNRAMNAVSPMFGLVWRVRPLISLYTNVASAFETPTITELTNQPDGKLGLNQELAPQRTRTVEMGAQAIIGAHVKLDGAVFHASARDELVGFDVPGAVGRRAFRNAGRTRRDGLEANVSIVANWGEAGAAYTLSRFNFVNYSVGAANYAGNPIPGVPKHQGQAYLTLRSRGWYLTSEASSASRVTADDAATVFASSWTTLGLRAGRAPTNNRFLLEPTIGIDNVFNRKYASAVVINATRGRYFEPGVGQRVFVALRVGATPWSAAR